MSLPLQDWRRGTEPAPRQHCADRPAHTQPARPDPRQCPARKDQRVQSTEPAGCADGHRELAAGGDRTEQTRRRLANRNPACRRPPGRPCHADVSLEIANSLSERLIKAEIERGNDAHTGLTVHRRHGKAAPNEQPVTMTLGNLAVLFTRNNANL